VHTQTLVVKRGSVSAHDFSSLGHCVVRLQRSERFPLQRQESSDHSCRLQLVLGLLQQANPPQMSEDPSFQKQYPELLRGVHLESRSRIKSQRVKGFALQLQVNRIR
jgi:hypothetical protein